MHCVLKLIHEGVFSRHMIVRMAGLAVALAESCLSHPAEPSGAVVKLGLDASAARCPVVR